MSSKHERRRRERPRVIEGSSVSQGELERKEPGVSLEFFGWDHAPLNLQVIPQVQTALNEFIVHTKGPVIIFGETVDATPEINSRVRKVTSQVGYQGAVLVSKMLSETGRMPSIREVEERKRRIAGSSLSVVFAEDLLPLDGISNYFIFGIYDEVLLQRRNVRVEWETHSKKAARNIQDVEARMHAIGRQMGWGTIDLEHSLSMFLLDQQEACIEMERLRKPDIVNDLASKTRELRQRGGGVFLIFGTTHADLVEDVQKRVDPENKYISTDIRAPLNTHHELVIGALKRGERPSDEMLARAFFAIECSHALDKLFERGGGNLQGYAENFQTIDAAIQDVGSALSLNDIRRLDDTKESLLKVFFAHPASRVILPYLH